MNKVQRMLYALIISAMLFAPASALALSDLDTSFSVQLHGHLKRTVPCDFLTISNGKLNCTGILFEQILVSSIKQLDVVYMGKEFSVSEINEGDIKSVNAMSMKKERAVAAQQRATQPKRRGLAASTEGVDLSAGLPSERRLEEIQQQRAAQQASRQKVTANTRIDQVSVADSGNRKWSLKRDGTSNTKYYLSFVLAFVIIGTSSGLLAAFYSKGYDSKSSDELGLLERAVKDGTATIGQRIGQFAITFIGCALSPMHIILIIVLTVLFSMFF